MLALRHYQPQLRVGVVEAGAALAGNHTWCLHQSDVPRSVWRWLQPAVAHQWPGYQVAFPELERRVALPYAAILSERFAQLVQGALQAGQGALWLNQPVQSCSARSVLLANGQVLRAQRVIDARGALPVSPAASGFQKFVGHEVELTAPHRLTEPMLMDARVAQRDGLRFVYVLPFGPTRLLVEDTVFSDRPQLDRDGMTRAIERYCAERGWTVAKLIRQEAGVLPMPWRVTQLPAGDVLAGGTRGGWFHPLTGYSLPEAARLADALAQLPLAHWEPAVWRSWHAQLARRTTLARTMCFALFQLAEPADRVAMLARFYRRDDVVVARFYGLQSTLLDAWRIFAGRPPRAMRWWPRGAGAQAADDFRPAPQHRGTASLEVET